jgi:hypothetical protein
VILHQVVMHPSAARGCRAPARSTRAAPRSV